jgi:hypothetical protein
MSSNTNEHIEKYDNANNEDIWYRQPFKWSDFSKVTGFRFGKYEIEWDSYNKTLANVSQQENNGNSILNFYKELTEIKNFADFPINGTYNDIDAGTNVFAFSLSKGNVTYNIYINGISNNIDVSPNGTVVKRLNASGNTLNAYGVIVSKSGETVPTNNWYIVGDGSFVNGPAWSIASGIAMEINTLADIDGVEYMKLNQHFVAGDVFKLTNGNLWISNGWEKTAGSAFANNYMSEITGGDVLVNTTGNYDIYFKVFNNGTYSCWIAKV